MRWWPFRKRDAGPGAGAEVLELQLEEEEQPESGLSGEEVSAMAVATLATLRPPRRTPRLNPMQVLRTQ